MRLKSVMSELDSLITDSFDESTVECARDRINEHIHGARALKDLEPREQEVVLEWEGDMISRMK